MLTAESPRLSIRPLHDQDISQLQHLTDDPAITTAIHILPSPFTLTDARVLIATANQRSSWFLGAWSKASGALVAVVVAELHESDEIEIGYWVGVAHQGNGYATEAAKAVIETLRQQFANKQICAECRPQNFASRHILEKLGFYPTGKAGHRPGRELFLLHMKFRAQS